MQIEAHPLDEVRASFRARLSRICLSLGLAHFLCIPPLYWLFSSSLATEEYRYLGGITLSGMLLSLIAFLCRYPRMRGVLGYFCLALLFAQSSFYLGQANNLLHPLTMLFPLLCSLATPILGRRASYAVAALTSIVFCYFHFAVFPEESGGLATLALLHLVVFLSAYLSELMWNGMITRERELQRALAALKAKTEEMETWVHRLGEASSLISSGKHSTELPAPPPSQVFQELTRSMGQMQEKLNQYFTNLVLKDRLSSIGVLASGIAHEINTPLTSLQFLIQGSELPQDTEDTVLTEVDRMSGIAKGLLSFARPRDDEETLDLNDIIRSSRGLLAHFETRQLEVKLEQSPEHLLVRGMKNELQQVLLNLFHNAVDAVEGVRNAEVVISSRKSTDGNVELAVSDNGMGIEPSDLKKILDPFYTTKSPGKGTGLGLFIVHQIAERHGALLEIESQKGRGTQVRLVFPANQKRIAA